MRIKKGGGLDRRFKGAKEGEAALVILVILIALAAAVLYFIYIYLHIIAPIIVIVLHFIYLKDFKTKYVLYSSLISLFGYIAVLTILVYSNIQEPFKLYGSYYEVPSNGEKLTIFDNKDFKQRNGERATSNEYNLNIVNRSKESIELADNYPDLPILAFTNPNEGKNGVTKYSYYGALQKKSIATYETTLEKIFRGDNKSYNFTNGNPTYTLELVLENYNWYGKFKGIKFNFGTIFHPLFVIISVFLSIIASFFYFNYFKKLESAKKEVD